MTRLARSFSIFAAALAILLGDPGTGFAQYLYLDANADGVNTSADVLQPSGPTTFDVWIVTDHNRDGSPATCAAEPATALTILSYELIVHAVNGTVTWGETTNERPEFSIDFGRTSDGTDLHFGFGGTAPLPAGTYKLATATVTPATGTPSLEFAPSSPLAGTFLTSFGSECPGSEFDFTLKLGSEWSDADGAAYGGVANHVPVLESLTDVTVPEGTMLDVGLTATDLDGEPLSFSLSSGPSWTTVTTLDPGTGTATGNLRLAPTYIDAGSALVTVSVTDGVGTDSKSLNVEVPNTNRAPVLMQPSDMMPVEGTTMQQLVSATDADASPLSFYKESGPMWMTVTTLEPGVARGLIELSPPLGTSGTMTGVLGVTDGDLSDTKSFTIMAKLQNTDPMLRLPGMQTIEEGELLSFTIMAMDADGDPVTITAMGLPMGATFTDLGGGDATFTWVPGFDQAGMYPITITAMDDRGGSASEGMSVNVTEIARATALARPLDMMVAAGGTAEQMLRGYDASGDPLTFEKVSGPMWLTVETTMPLNPSYSALVPCPIVFISSTES